MPDFSEWVQGASTSAVEVDLIALWLLAWSTFFGVLVLGLIAVFSIRYRRTASNQVPEQVEGSTRLEIAWAVVPLILALITFAWAAQTFFNLSVPPANALDVYVVGKQWMWEIQHASGRREINTLHVPVGQPVRLTMTSQDVIHSFGIPAFRLKWDVTPGRYTTAWFQAERAGTYHIFCMEYCGTGHSIMLASLTAMPPEEYEDWLNGGIAADSPEAIGAALFTRYGCNGCHMEDGSGRGPSLMGIFGQTVELENGETVVADENYLHESIVNPQAKIVRGYEPIMPSYRGQLNETELMSLILYLKARTDTTEASTP